MRFQFSLVACALCLLAACVDETESPRTPREIEFDMRDTVYFSAQDAAHSQVERFGGGFHELGDPSFRSASLPDSSALMRFFWRRSFEPHILVRVVLNPSRCVVHAIVLGPSTFEFNEPSPNGLMTPRRIVPGTLRRMDSTFVPANSCRELLGKFRQAAEWDASAKPNDIGVDGSDWVFEMRDALGHRAFSRFTPDSAGSPAVWQAGIAALVLARVLPPDERVY